MTWEARAVDDTGTVIDVIAGVNVGTAHRGLLADEYADLTIGTLHSKAPLFAPFSHEIQLWLDDQTEPYLWGTNPYSLDIGRQGPNDTMLVRTQGLFSYFYDAVVGGEKVNHIVSPHLDAAAVGALPNSWAASPDVDLHAVVDNNYEFWHIRKAIQVNNHDTGQNAFIWQRIPVPPELVDVPFQAAASCYISDSEAGSPPWGGPAYQQRGLALFRTTATGVPISEPKIAKITKDTKRGERVRLQTEELIPKAGEYLEVRLYAPNAWTAWLWAGLFDGRWEGVDRADKSLAVKALVDHFQDPTVGKQDRKILLDLATIGETVTKQWPWYRRENIGEQLRALADTFEFEMATTATTRTLRVRQQVGVHHPVTLTKDDVGGWALSADRASAYSRQIRQGEGSGIARDEWWVDDLTALSGTVRERLSFAQSSATLARLRDQANADLARSKNVDKLPQFTIAGDLAKTIRPGDTLTVDLDHGAAQYAGVARLMASDLDKDAFATLNMEPVE